MTFQATVAERISSTLQDEHGGEQFLHFVKAVSSELNQEDQSTGSGQLRMATKRKVREVGPLKSTSDFLGVGVGLMNQRSLECLPVVTVTSCFNSSNEWHKVKKISSLLAALFLCPTPSSHSLLEGEGDLRASLQLPHTKDDRTKDQRRKVSACLRQAENFLEAVGENLLLSVSSF